MIAISDLDEAIASIRDTDSGKVEYNSNSLEAVLGRIRDLLIARTVATAGSVSEMVALPQSEGRIAIVPGVGTFAITVTPTPPDNTTSFTSSHAAPPGMYANWVLS